MMCPQSNCGKSNCGSCCGGCRRELVLTEAETAMLGQLAQFPFLPLSRDPRTGNPVYLGAKDRTPEEYGRILTSLKLKGLVSLDYDLPLVNFDYVPYQSYPVHGSMALTALGQEAIELLEIQGIEA